MLTRLLFENLAALALVAVIVELVLLWAWAARRTRRSGRVVVVGLLLFAAMLLLSHLVVTVRERVVGLCRRLAVLADAGDVTGVGGHLAEDFAAAHWNREEFLQLVSARLREYPLDELGLSGFEVEFPSPNDATAVFDAVCRVRSPEGEWGRILSRWRLTIRRSDGGWLVSRIEAQPSPLSPVKDLRSLLH